MLNTIVQFFMVVTSFFPAIGQPLPKVLPAEREDIAGRQLKLAAAAAFQRHTTLPRTTEEWTTWRQQLREKIVRETGMQEDHVLPLDVKETGRIQQQGYSIRNISFQTRPGVYATANLYMPDGPGPFPAVINMHGHWPGARTGDMVQATAHELAGHGYICLNIDAWGAGERTTTPGVAEYHGASLGASLMNAGATLMGMQLTDNMRGVDLLCSLPQADKKRIGATGASGGGNQTMWLTAMDERIKAAVPVVSVGTFEAYILNSNCVCELLPSGLTFTEEAGILAMAAPRALKVCNAEKDASKSFYPSEMLRSYKAAIPLFQLLKAGDRLQYQLFDTTHGYWPEIRSTMLGWFDQHLKGTGNGGPVPLPATVLLPAAQLLTFPSLQRDSNVMSTAAWCRQAGSEWRANMLGHDRLDVKEKRAALKAVLKEQQLQLKTIHPFSPEQGWDRLALETTDGELLPLLHRKPRKRENGYVILTHSGGKDSIPSDRIDELLAQGYGVVLADLWGTGEQSSETANKIDGSLPRFHTLARSALWLGHTLQGKWVSDLRLLTGFLRSHYGVKRITLEGYRETAMAGLFLAALEPGASKVVLHNSPISYQFAGRQGVDYFNMSIHLPGFLPWGDVSLAAALTGREIELIAPVDMSGNPVNGLPLKFYRDEFQEMRKRCRQRGQLIVRTAAANFNIEK
ncbi:acetylxylan esterase [Chitinophaga sp.]|uniref:alpha/beta hydrolase family protein n=1 Tax=Chitinophaga sp. TaxID=1869181 RepID=UPI0031CFDFC9